MLELKKISKVYQIGEFKQKALDNVSMSFKGFTVDGKGTVVFEPSSKSNVGSKPARDSSFSEEYIITDIIILYLIKIINNFLFFHHCLYNSKQIRSVFNFINKSFSSCNLVLF